ncbi:MAG: hypothetical protein M3Y72_16795 [Acidobacteriota bacterium]|nr:hypothetical protein [Acidobacteriota bacterium]
MQTSFDDCRRELLSKANAHGQAAYEQWRNRNGYQKVVRFVEGFTHQFIYALSPADIQDTVTRTGHALGDVAKEEAIRSIQDFTCPFALHYIFHEFPENKQEIPLWEDFDAHIHHRARDKWWNPLRQSAGTFPDIQQLITVYGRDEAWSRVKRAVRWRLGNFYLSAMRELDLFIRLRHIGVPLRYHILADVLLRVDFWTPDTLLCVYFLNSRSRQEAGDRAFFLGRTCHTCDLRTSGVREDMVCWRRRCQRVAG